MKNYTDKQIMSKVLESITCDSCNKLIDINKEYLKIKVSNSTGSWYWKDTEHEEKEYCSPSCMLENSNELKQINNIIYHDEFELFNIEVVNKN